jgi:hypothetical protein
MRRTGVVFAVVLLACGGVASSALAVTLSQVARSPFPPAPPLLPSAVAAPFSIAVSRSGGLLATADPGSDGMSVLAVKRRLKRFSAVPAQLPSSGGNVKLEAVVRRDAHCLFSSGNRVSGLPARRRCASGRASVTITLPANTTPSAKTYEFSLTARTAAGRRTTKHVVVVELAQPVAQPQPVVQPQPVAQPQPVVEPQPVVAPQPVAPQITVQPQSQAVPVGNYATFTAAASGVPIPSVAWQVSSDGGASWAAAPPNAGQIPTSDSVLVWGQAGTYSGSEYRAVFTNVAGSATTSPATLTAPINENALFAGYLDYAPPGESFTAASADWVVPAITCAIPYSTFAAQWPGVGENTSVVQDGTIEGCYGTTLAPDAAWYELVGDAAVNGGSGGVADCAVSRCGRRSFRCLG